MSNPLFWQDGTLTRRAKHFMGMEHTPGTAVQFRPYERDDNYIEVLLPDGYLLTMFPDMVELPYNPQLGPSVNRDGTPRLTDPKAH